MGAQGLDVVALAQALALPVPPPHPGHPTTTTSVSEDMAIDAPHLSPESPSMSPPCCTHEDAPDLAKTCTTPVGAVPPGNLAAPTATVSPRGESAHADPRSKSVPAPCMMLEPTWESDPVAPAPALTHS